MTSETQRQRNLQWPGLLLAATIVLITACMLWFGRRANRPDFHIASTQGNPPKSAAGQGSTEQRPTDSDFLGSQACAACHLEIAEAWRSHPMSNSFAHVTRLPPESESASPVVKGKTHQYEVVMRDGQMVHRDEMFDAEGKSIFSQSVPMDYVVGSGRRAFAYVYQQGHLLFQSPINWYTQDAKWDISPGYHVDDERRFRRRITDDCLSCHAGRVAAEGRGLNRYKQPAFRELTIGCERCHGPGKQHVRFRRSRQHAPGEPDPIVNPAQLEIAARESVCNQCHLQTAARILRYGHCDFDFTPGKHFEDIWTALDTGTDVSADGRTKAVNHVQQMRDSRCYAGSGGKLGCTSCHDPHRIPAPQEELSWYRSRCLECHTPYACSADMSVRQRKDDSCIACHMPRRDSSNISHVTQTDHRVSRIPFEPAQDESPSTQLRFFDEADKRLADWERDRALGAGIWSYLSRKGQQAPLQLENLLGSSLAVHEDDGLVLSTLGALEMQHQRWDAAGKYFEIAILSPESEENAAVGLLELSYHAGDWQRALEYADRCLAIDPGHPGCHAIRADCLLNSGRLSEAIAAAEKSIELDPTRIAVRQWLVSALEKADRLTEAAAMRDIIRRMQTATAPK